jgi:hypothetical protein
MSVKVAIAALASYELSHECQQQAIALPAKNSRCSIHQMFIDCEYSSIFEPNCELVRP